MTRIPLPVDACLAEVVGAAREDGAVVLTAPPGSGKTTRVPAALVDAGIDGEVVVLEPRRVAARAAARHVASERGSPLGREVGYQVRHDKQVSSATRIRFVTEGVLTRRLLDDPFLEGVGAVVLDEFHERHVDGDLALAMLQEVRETVRDDLWLVAMSATLDAEPLAAFLAPCRVVTADGRLHAVDVRNADRPVGDDELVDAVVDAVRTALEDTRGDVLVFLSGVGEIARCDDALDALRGRVDVLPLHGSLSPDQQDRAIAPRRDGDRRKVVLATNVAESSLTIDGVTAVVDSGLARVPRHDPVRGLDTLNVERISRASADQRAGRAGRTAPGICYRLWSRVEDRALAPAELPELRRVDVVGPALAVRAFAAGRDPKAFRWFEAPDSAALEAADRLLVELGAVDRDARHVTAVGRALLDQPLPPRLARVLHAATGEFHVDAELAATVVALLAERDLALERPGPDQLDARLAAFAAAESARFGVGRCRSLGVHAGAARAVARARDQLLRGRSRGRGRSAAVDAETGALARSLLAGFPDRVAVVTDVGSGAARMVGGRGVVLRAKERGLANGDLVLVLEVLGGGSGGGGGGGGPGRRARAGLVVELEPAWLQIEERVVASVDETRGRVVGVRQRCYRDLVLAEQRGEKLDPAVIEELLGDLVAAEPFRFLGEQKELRRFLGRVAWLRDQAPDLELPELGDGAVGRVARGFCSGGRTLASLAGADVLSALAASELTSAQRRELDRHAPDRVPLPSGRRVRVDYDSGEHPFIAVRMQELFGTADVPRLACGRVALVVHLLAPNHRPVQITTDLPSFWANVYPQVRGELSRRYPKHSWPVDPLTAVAESRPRRRRS